MQIDIVANVRVDRHIPYALWRVEVEGFVIPFDFKSDLYEYVGKLIATTVKPYTITEWEETNGG